MLHLDEIRLFILLILNFAIQITLLTIFFNQSESESSMVKRKPSATNANVPNRR